jgi:alcohol dehydrogenase class IV
MNFEFATATKIVFGAGKLDHIGSLAAPMGWRALVTIGVDLDRAQPLLKLLADSGIVTTIFMVKGEPEIETIAEGIEFGRREKCDMVVGFGGGSAIDAGKAISALITNQGDIINYLEVIGQGQSLVEPPVPFIAIPTTAGTGAEVTRNAVLKSTRHKVKVSLRSPMLLPKLALVDPELTHSMPPDVTASTGLDALTQVIEPFVSNKANPLTDTICREGMNRAARSLRRVYEQADDVLARQDMSLASLCGGLALANAGLGAVHGFAGTIGGMFDAPHGVICARLLPYVIEVNITALKEREGEHPALRRYAETARILTANPEAQVAELIEWIHELCKDLNVSPLSSFGISKEDFPVLIEKSAQASSMKPNPVELTEQEMYAILEKAL